MKIFLKRLFICGPLPILFSCLFFSFTRDSGNSGGSPRFSMSGADGVFNIYNVTYDLNFGQPPVNKTQYAAYFLQSRGDTSSKFFNGDLSFSNNSLHYSDPTRIYIDSCLSSIDNSGVPASNCTGGSNTWKLLNSGNQTDFNYYYARGLAFISFDSTNSLKDTVSIRDTLSVNLNGMGNADSIVVTVSGFNGAVLNKRNNGLVQRIQITPHELSPFLSGGVISFSAFNIAPSSINGKNYLFSSIHQYVKLVYFKP